MERGHSPELQKLSFAIDELVAERTHNAKLIACGEMAAEVAHDIKQPLTIIHKLAEKAGTNLDDPKFKALFQERLCEAVRRLRRLADDLTDFARKEPLREECNLADLLEDAVQEYEQRKIETARPIRLELDTKDAKCFVDPLALRRVVLNLLENAQAASNGRGNIRVRLKQLTEAGNTFQIQVKDDGLGIDDAQMSLIFDPFFTTKRNGTGLGLSISKKIVNQHGGELFARTKKGKGSTFGILLPIQQEEIQI